MAALWASRNVGAAKALADGGRERLKVNSFSEASIPEILKMQLLWGGTLCFDFKCH